MYTQNETRPLPQSTSPVNICTIILLISIAHNYTVNVKHNVGIIWRYNEKKPIYEFKVGVSLEFRSPYVSFAIYHQVLGLVNTKKNEIAINILT